ncbi:MAG: metallophosphoesterase [Candidatus Micrarchaeota archaeon]|nr:metallophosphoesterase [Candidatus Micrarchaeota archaeon]
MAHASLKFVYGEPALIAGSGRDRHLVVADLHIGMELKLSKRGIHLFNATDRMAERIRRIMGDFSIDKLVILGDVKDSILYPEGAEIKLLKGFFRQMEGFDLNIVAGNHDAHLESIIGHDVVKELVVGDFGFVHGNRKPGEEMMMLSYIISAHDHLAVRMKDKNGAIYEQKAWAIYRLNARSARSAYERFNGKIRLVSMPAFNELITGTAIGDSPKRLNPLLSSGIFSARSAEVYNISGQRVKARG